MKKQEQSDSLGAVVVSGFGLAVPSLAPGVVPPSLSPYVLLSLSVYLMKKHGNKL